MANNELTIIDHFKNDIVIKDGSEYKIPLATVFGKGSFPKQESFGGLTLAENAKRTDLAIDNMKSLLNIWNHSHSQFDWKHIVMSFYSPWRNMEQVEAEMSRKRAALNEAKWRQVRNEIELKKCIEQLEKGNLEYWDEIDLKVKIAEMQEGLADGTQYIEGAMKDVLALHDIYESLKKEVANFTEEDMEKEEAKCHLMRSVSQCLRDIRQFGTITKGEQEYLEQIGVNPGKAMLLFRRYVEEEAKMDSWDNTGLLQFINDFATDMIDNHKVDAKRILAMGFRHEAVGDIGYSKPVAVKEE